MQRQAAPQIPMQRKALRLSESHVLIREGKPAPLTDALHGRKIERCISTAGQLLIRCTDGTEVRVSWRNEKGQISGAPMLDDVRRWK